MQIDESRKLLLSDTMVPDIFILEYLPGLSGLAVKIYLFLTLTARTSHTVTEQDLSRRMGTDTETIRTSLLELASSSLIDIRDKRIEINDIKAAEIDRLYRPRTTAWPEEALQAQARSDRREKLMSDIARTFFQGLMSPSWYGEIDSWYDRYGFEPEVIYALFQECARRNKLESRAYIAKVAENWSRHGIVTFDDLNRYFLDYGKVSKISRKVGRKLRKTMTEYDDEIVARWINEWGYDFDLIELALRKTSRMSAPNLAFVDRILQEWHDHQLRDQEAITAYEADKAARIGKGRQASGNQAHTPGNVGNFDQRQYSEAYLSSFYESVADPDHLQTDTAESLRDETDRDAQAAVHDSGEARQTGDTPARPGNVSRQLDLDDLMHQEGKAT